MESSCRRSPVVQSAIPRSTYRTDTSILYRQVDAACVPARPRASTVQVETASYGPGLEARRETIRTHPSAPARDEALDLSWDYYSFSEPDSFKGNEDDTSGRFGR